MLPKVLGATTGVGAENVKTAYSSGANGKTDFWDNLTGKVPMTNVLDDAKANLAAMGQASKQENQQKKKQRRRRTPKLHKKRPTNVDFVLCFYSQGLGFRTHI